MNNFIFQNPTKIIFGENTIAKLAQELPNDQKIMVTFGSGSVKTNGVYDQVVAALEGKNYVEFWGIEPNPTVETLRKAVALGKAENVTFLLAVGGGSVVDGTKLISSAIPFDGDAWDLVLHPENLGEMIPLAAVLTLPATGSEMNRGAVISNHTTKEKYAFYSSFPTFSILDPTVTYSLPPFQVACGIVDTFIHVLEQYLTTTGQSMLMDRWAEGILQTLVELAPTVMENHQNYEAMSNFMLCATMALNGFTAMGVSQDWATHLIGHEISAIHNTTHGQTLAIVLLGVMEVMRTQKQGKIVQFGERVFQITEGTTEERIDATIQKCKEFFRSLGLATNLTEINVGDETILEIEKRFNERGTKLGEMANIDGTVAKQILTVCK